VAGDLPWRWIDSDFGFISCGEEPALGSKPNFPVHCAGRINFIATPWLECLFLASRDAVDNVTKRRFGGNSYCALVDPNPWMLDPQHTRSLSSTVSLRRVTPSKCWHRGSETRMRITCWLSHAFFGRSGPLAGQITQRQRCLVIASAASAAARVLTHSDVKPHPRRPFEMGAKNCLGASTMPPRLEFSANASESSIWGKRAHTNMLSGGSRMTPSRCGQRHA
jgi:hypothetical protein